MSWGRTVETWEYRNFWTEEDDQRLKRLLEFKAPYRSVSKILQRSRPAIVRRVSILRKRGDIQ